MTKEILKLQQKAQDIIKKTKINAIMLRITKNRRQIKEYKRVIEYARISTETAKYLLKNLDPKNSSHEREVKWHEQEIRDKEKEERITKHQYSGDIAILEDKEKELEEVIIAWEKEYNQIPIKEIELMTNVLIIKEQTNVNKRN